MEPHKGQQEVLDSPAPVRVLQWGRRAGKTEALRMALESEHRTHHSPILITVDNAEYLDHDQIDALLALAYSHAPMVVAFTLSGGNDPVVRLKKVPGVAWFRQPSWINTPIFPLGADDPLIRSLRESLPDPVLEELREDDNAEG